MRNDGPKATPSPSEPHARSARRPYARERPYVVAACAGLLAFAACRSGATAADPTHWLTPSHYQHSRGALFESGIPRSDEATQPRTTEPLLREGRRLYDIHCSTCHGAVDSSGTPGAPSLRFSGGAVADFYVSTGRMPAADVAAVHGTSAKPVDRILAAGTQYYHMSPLFDARQTAALVAYVTSQATTSLPIPNVRLDPALLQRGRLLFENNCEACHGAAGQGATAGAQWTALPLNRATPRQIAEAIRIGPGVMPRFTSRQLSDDDVNAIATYVRYLMTNSQTYGGTVMEYLGPISEGAVSAFIGVGFLFWVIYFTGTKSDGRRFNEID